MTLSVDNVRSLKPGGLKRERDDDDVDIIGLARTLWRGKWLIAAATVLSVAIAALYLIYVAVPVYASKAVVALDIDEPRIVDLESVVSSFGGDQTSVNTEAEVLRSRALLGAVVDRLDLVSDPEFNRELAPSSAFEPRRWLAAIGLTQAPGAKSAEEERNAVIDALSEATTINNIRQTYVFEITTRSEDPQKARDLANVTADLYLESQLEAKFEATQRATKWLTDRVAELQIALEDAEQAVKDFSVQADLVGIEVLEAAERQVKDLRDRAAEAEVAEKASQERLKQLQEASGPEELVALTRDPTLRRLQNDDLGDSAAFDARTAQLVTRAEAAATRAREQAQALRLSVAELELDTSVQAQDLVRLRQLQREAEASRLIYEYFLSRLKETSVQQGIQQPDARILSMAVAPLAPAAPRKGTTLLVFALLGVAIGAGLVLLREIAQSTYRNPEMLEEDTGYPVIGQIPQIAVNRRQKVKDYLVQNPTSAASEAIRNIRTTLLLQNLDTPPQVILSTSSVPVEGKTTQSVGLALNMAQMGKRVLLIEGDIRRRVFQSYFDIPSTKGLVTVLSGAAAFEDVVFHDPALKIDILQGEKAQINAADLYTTQSFKTFLDDMRARYDFIVFDTPPVLVVPDARIVAQHCDAIVYTVRWDSTSKIQVRRGLRSFEDVGLNIDGLVLSQVDAKGLKSYGYEDYSASEYYEEAT